MSHTDQSHLQLIMHLSVGLLMLLLLIFALLLLIWGFKSIYRPPAPMPLNLVSELIISPVLFCDPQSPKSVCLCLCLTHILNAFADFHSGTVENTAEEGIC